MRLLTVLSLGIFLLLLSIVGALKFYQGSISNNIQIEQRRLSVDAYLRNGFIARNALALWINQYIFHNNDKYTWYPPRILPVYSKDRKLMRYRAYGMVTSWDPDNKLLSLSSYLGAPMYVRFEPRHDGPVAFINHFDQFGEIQLGDSQFVQSTDIPNWNTLFCQHDIIGVEAKTGNVFTHSSQGSPLVPMIITLFQRLCNQ